MENYHSKSLTTREKVIIILGMVYIAMEDDNDIDMEEGFAIEFNAGLLQITMNEYQNKLKTIQVPDDQLLFRELRNLSYDNKKFVVRAFHSVANTSPQTAIKKITLMCNMLIEDIGIKMHEIEAILSEQ
ncbi:hypothetical protein [Paenimyroides aestuarii]|uniref:Co-chaperone DjlA N-terminal domain-containing protein n=1 Tax=Paenimyroides aestuarii TaxID=2968490 RepID=A0ABY5NTA7_9FLAO|nr:hypothetical protein [Paenimyroides aestuarii]UUV21818.1 hypothetical protein NPX36_01835 [Paenimyroides aestuarii]